MKKDSTIDLHNIKNEVYLGYLSGEPYKPSAETIDISYFGGEPTWLYAPNINLQTCKDCRTNLAFLGQMYCPFDAEHTYHRVLYFMFCDRCLRSFKCIRQQAKKDWKPSQNKIQSSIKKCCEDAYEVENDPMSKKQLIKMMNKVKQELQEQKIIEEAPSQDEADDEQFMKEITQNREKMMIKEEVSEDQSGNLPGREVQEKYDILFQQYKKVISQLNGPCMLYTDSPLPYNSQPLHPRHFCQACGSKLALQVQITQKILFMDEKNPNSRLFLLDWGSLMLYTCSASCQQGLQEEIILQYEEDAIKEEEIKKLKKRNKNKKKSERKSLSKGKQKKGQKSDEQKEGEGQGQTQQSGDNVPEKDDKEEEGDWD